MRTFLAEFTYFWSVDDCQKLTEILKDPEHERANLLILRADVHRLWDKHRFCLKPKDATGTSSTLELEFLWLSQDHGQPSSAISHQPTSPTKRAIITSNGHALSSGDKVTLTTRDTRQFPLPNRFLLDLQFNLHRALRASVAREVVDRIFRKKPDPDSTPTANAEAELGFDNPAPQFTRLLIDEAVELGIVDESDRGM